MQLSPRVYFAVDRLTKLVGLLALAGGIGGAFGSLSPVVAIAGAIVGVATVFVESSG
ncbi:hypothetical protein SAMN04488065_1722 [Haloplanus vescus]|uniref:DUF8120 domain-containing protein n=1 Tax=Haloplanus vescus TaxID=555874 RepID=A0A1H3Y8F1_9EURY|nr:hypothetical protein [Haloplanus vescus]SEA07853.1 hypothetical protein SAMN04488065_1722 [Haloplanus vescus]